MQIETLHRRKWGVCERQSLDLGAHTGVGAGAGAGMAVGAGGIAAAAAAGGGDCVDVVPGDHTRTDYPQYCPGGYRAGQRAD